MDLRTRKGRLRRAMAARRRAVPAGRAERAAHAVAMRIAALPEWGRAAQIAVYAPADGELDTAPLVARAREAGLSVLWPRVEGDALVFAACAPEALVAGSFGIPEPPADLPAATLGPDDLLSVPGLAFDFEGGRLGRGAGCYDRTLRDGGPLRLGLGYDFQCVDHVPQEEGDRRMDVVVTEHRLIRVGGSRR